MKLSGKFKSNLAFIIMLSGALVVYAFVTMRRQILPELLAYYSETFFFDTKDFAYEKVEPALFDHALIFYGVRFPGIPVSHRISRMQVSEKQGRISISFEGIKFNVMRAVEALHADQIEQIMRHYIPFDSVAAYPLESMLLAGIRHFDGRLHLVFKPKENKQVQINGFLSAKGIADVSFVLTVNAVPRLNPLSFVFGAPVSAQVLFKDKGALSEYLNYAHQAGVLVPQHVSALEQTETFKWDRSLSDIFQ